MGSKRALSEGGPGPRRKLRPAGRELGGAAPLALAGLFAGAHLALSARERSRDRGSRGRRTLAALCDRFGEGSIRELYPDLSRQDIAGLLDESFDSAVLTYDPHTQFRSAARAGRYVNVSEAGYRFGRDQAGWPPDSADLTVFVFGGSRPPQMQLSVTKLADRQDESALYTVAPN